jgi:glycosyltransferase involved in cell wall biosynthesis
MTVDQRRLRVTVITPVRNGAADIAELLECLERQTLPRADFEIVIGDDGSTDGGTTGIDTPDGHVRVAFGPPRNSYATRNMAVAASRGEVLAFCDADCRPEPDWLERGLAALESTDIVAGRFRFALPERITPWTLIDMDGSKDHEHQVRLGLAETANLFIRRELFDRLGGLDGSIHEYGDYEFAWRAVTAGARLTYAHDAVVWHPTRDTRRPLLRALWKYNRGYAVHTARAGEVPASIRLREWVPVVQTYRSRRRFGRSIGPDRRWLQANDVHPSPVLTLRSLPILYLVVPYLRCTAQLAGWLEGRRMRELSAPIVPSDGVGSTA